MHYVLQYVCALLLFVVVDLVWLGAVAKSYYHRELGDLIADKFNLWAAAAFYLIYPMGVVAFAVAPSASGTWVTAVTAGAFLGFFAYATYDLTNLATLRNWPLTLTLVDMAWGTFLTAVVAALVHIIGPTVR